MEPEIGKESPVSSIKGQMYNAYIVGKRSSTLNLSKDPGYLFTYPDQIGRLACHEAGSLAWRKKLELCGQKFTRKDRQTMPIAVAQPPQPRHPKRTVD